MAVYRTLLEQKIKERRQTFEEFAEFAEVFARKNGELGTISVRHLLRLVAGRGSDGQPLGAVRPATARLLERIFRLSVEELLSAPVEVASHAAGTTSRRRVELAATRKGVGHTQESLAEALHVDRSTVVRWEAGGHEPLPYLRPKMARLLGCSAKELDELIRGPATTSGSRQLGEESLASQTELVGSLPSGSRIRLGGGWLRSLRRGISVVYETGAPGCVASTGASLRAR
ncbi:helix-turn-helix transcriptional regulator [Actinophytocola sediminis]